MVPVLLLGWSMMVTRGRDARLSFDAGQRGRSVHFHLPRGRLGLWTPRGLSLGPVSLLGRGAVRGLAAVSLLKQLLQLGPRPVDGLVANVLQFLVTEVASCFYDGSVSVDYSNWRC